MCGIVGYIGAEEAAPILLDGLERPECRGYDSAGLTVWSETAGLKTVKAKGVGEWILSIANVVALAGCTALIGKPGNLAKSVTVE